MFWKKKYLKYKKKYINYKNKLLTLYGSGKADYYEIEVNESDVDKMEVEKSEDENKEDENLENKKALSNEDKLYLNIKKELKKNIFLIENIDINIEQSTINTIIEEFFFGNQYLLLLNDIINYNIKLLFNDLEIKFGFNLKSIKNLLEAADIEISEIKKNLSNIKNIQEIEKQEFNLCKKMEKKEEKIDYYKLALFITKSFDNFFTSCKVKQNNFSSEIYEEFINRNIISRFSTLKYPILYLSNIDCKADNSIFPPPPNENRDKYQYIKSEIDGIILIQKDLRWKPIIIFEMKNNMDLVLDDISASSKLLEMLRQLHGEKDIIVKNKKFKINLDGFKDVNFLYCVNNITLEKDSKFNFSNFEKIKDIIQKDLISLIKQLPENNSFINSFTLSDYILNILEDVGFDDFSEKEKLNNKLLEIDTNKESSKKYGLPEPLIDIDIKSIPLDKSLDIRKINVSTKIDSDKIFNLVGKEVELFNNFFQDEKNGILHIPIPN